VRNSSLIVNTLQRVEYPQLLYPESSTELKPYQRNLGPPPSTFFKQTNQKQIRWKMGATLGEGILKVTGKEGTSI
jgi:hypothetical protein